MKWTISVTILLSFNVVNAQTADTLPKAKAQETRYINIQKFDFQTNGNPYTVGLTLGASLTDPSYITKIDLITKQVTTKVLTGTYSHMGEYWNSTFDNSGKLYIPFNTTDYKVRSFNFKDSIQIFDVGWPFQDNTQVLAYSTGMGIDLNMYFGAKGNPYFSYYNPNNQQVTKYPAVNDYGIDWVLSITGDADYIYCTTGQNDSCNAWAIKKSDGTKRNLIKTASYTRPTLETGCDGFVYILNPMTSKWYKMVNGDTVNVPTWVGCRNSYNGITDITTYFDKQKSKLFWTGHGLNDSADITSSKIDADIRTIFTDNYNSNLIYYIGDYYGAFYQYNISGDSTIVLGNTGSNISSAVFQYNDSIYYWGNYPSGTVMIWNRNKTWTTGTFVNGQMVTATDINANPKIILTTRSSVMATHHITGLQYDAARNRLILAGLVERTDYTCSIGSCAMDGSDFKPYDANKIKDLAVNNLAKWNSYWLMSTSNAYGGTPKIYVYNPDTNTMVDSLNFGWNDYGRIWVSGDVLWGQAGTRFYRVNLSTKTVVYNQTGADSPLATRLEDESFIINGGVAPVGWAKTKTGNYTNYLNYGRTTYSRATKNIVRIQNNSSPDIDLNTLQGKIDYVNSLIR